MMMLRFTQLICLSCLIACSTNSRNDTFISQLPVDERELQQHIIGQLSGHQPLENGQILKARWSKKERQLTKAYLTQLISTLGIQSIEQDYVSPNANPVIDLLLEPYKGTNVYGVLKATKPTNSYVILGAHYDSGRPGAPGAIDNATGITLIYTVLKQMAELQHRNKNLLLVFFDQEEEENVGSQAFIKLIKENLWNVHSVHCFDMVGWDGDKNEEFEVFSASEKLIQLYNKSTEQYHIPLHILRIDPLKTSSGSTDYYEFLEEGFNAIGAGECVYKGDYSPYKDTIEDTYDTVDFNYLWSCTTIVSDVITELVSD